MQKTGSRTAKTRGFHRNRVITATVLAVSLLAGGCAKEAGESMVPLDYAQWPSTVDGPLDYTIPGHTQEVRTIYINQVGTTVVPETVGGRITYEYPEGTIIIKENFTNADDEEPNNLTVMIKDSDNAEASGGWLWLNRDFSSGRERSFGDDFCFPCHLNANERHPYGDGNADREFRDYVYYPWEPSTGS
jgi:hypothetical protein